MLYPAECVRGIRDQALIRKYGANVQKKQEHFKKTENFQYNCFIMSVATQASCFFFCSFTHSLTHSLLQTFRQMETSNPDSPVVTGITCRHSCLREVPAEHFCWVSGFFQHRAHLHVQIPGVFAPLPFLESPLSESHSVMNYFIIQLTLEQRKGEGH